MDVRILFEDKEIIVAVKPAAMLSQGDRSSAMDMVSYLKNQGRPYIGLIHRLDRPVGGVMVFAKTPQAAKELSRQLAEHKISKTYLAVLNGKPSDKQSECQHYMLKDKKTNLSRIVTKETKDAKIARLKYKIVNSKFVNDQSYSLAEIELITGRHHQIRLQMSHIGCGIDGDTKYNPDYIGKKGWFDLALFACRLEFIHPKTKKRVSFQAEPAVGAFELFQ